MRTRRYLNVLIILNNLKLNKGQLTIHFLLFGVNLPGFKEFTSYKNIFLQINIITIKLVLFKIEAPIMPLVCVMFSRQWCKLEAIEWIRGETVN